MDKRFKISKILIGNLIFLLLFALLVPETSSFGYDSSSSSCSPNTKQSRRGRAQMLAAIPCDLLTQAYCAQPGSAYPWHAVRRFVHENQGLMKRMYGDVRHISVLRDEIYNNEIDIDDIEAATERYSRDGYNRRSSKLMRHREEFENFRVNDRVNDILRDPHFRPVTTTTTTTTTRGTTRKTTTTETPITTSTTTTPEGVESTVVANDEETTTLASSTTPSTKRTTKGTTQNPNDVTDSELNTTNGEEVQDEEDEEVITRNENDTTKSENLFDNQINPDGDEDDLTTSADREDDLDIINIEANSIFDETSDDAPPTELTGENIEIVASPQLGLRNLTTEIPTTTNPSKTESSTVATKTTTNSPTIASTASTTEETTTSSKTTPTTSTSTTSTTIKPETVAERSPAKKERKPFVPSSTRLQQRLQQQQQGQKAESTISAKLKLKINPTQATPTKAATTTTITHLDKASLNATTLTTPLTSMKTSPFKTPSVSTTSPSPAQQQQQPIKPNSDLLLSEKIRRPGANITPPSVVSNKPIMKDGQLFQDTMKQEAPAPVLNVKGVNACPVKEEVVAPFWANNTRGEVLALLNLYPFEQYVHWEKCTHEHKQMYCREGCRCEQQYRLHRLLAYDPHNECRGIFSDWFRFPSCCICKCYNIPLDFRATSRSPRSEGGAEDYRHPIDIAEEQVKNAIYEHATEDWYRPKDDFDFYEG
ncbi:protein spaetzle 4 [Musca vetustissima]|uniref:protein spaetzle 4 n=1 Tax=Musca vetustissima TaxID=27455 RepID=UPI002AB76063|nr:protein spaetzle 4 [Musca vetustissima]